MTGSFVQINCLPAEGGICLLESLLIGSFEEQPGNHILWQSIFFKKKMK